MTGKRQFGTLRKLPSGRWQVRYRDAGGRRHTAPATFVSKSDAGRYLSTIQTDQLRGEWYDHRLGLMTVSGWTDRWRATTVDLRPSTRARDDSYLRSLILPTFAHLPLSSVDSLAVRAWVADLVASGRSPATVVKAAHIFSKIMTAAVDAGLIAASPCSGIRLPRVEREEMRFLSPDQVAALTMAMDSRYRAAVLLGAYGGLRAGELFGLRCRRFDPLRAKVDVTEIVVEVRGRLTFGPPKTRAGRRSVPLPRFVVEALTEHIAALNVGPDDPIFPAPEDGTVRLALWRRRFWAPAVEVAGLEPLRIHDLRHTAVALWIAAGASPKEIALRAGHTSVVTVLDRYGHLLPGTEERVNGALDALARAARPLPATPVIDLASDAPRHRRGP